MKKETKKGVGKNLKYDSPRRIKIYSRTQMEDHVLHLQTFKTPIFQKLIFLGI